MNRLIKAVAGMNHSVIYTDDSGRYFRFFGGTWAWRNHNPGNVKSGPTSKKHNQIGTVNEFAVFPDNEFGHEALLDVLKTKYFNSSIDEMVEKFAPPKENDTIKYIKYLHQVTGVKDKRKIKDFSSEEFEKLWRGIEHLECSKPGNVEEVYLVTQVRKKYCLIDSYFLENNVWITKDQCLDLAKSGRVDLEHCISYLGNQYLRTASSSAFQPPLYTLINDKE